LRRTSKVLGSLSGEPLTEVGNLLTRLLPEHIS
jgi:hypothetical protein